MLLFSAIVFPLSHSVPVSLTIATTKWRSDSLRNYNLMVIYLLPSMMASRVIGGLPAPESITDHELIFFFVFYLRFRSSHTTATLYSLLSFEIMQRTVVSLASDKAVWDAVMKNESVQELRAAFGSGFSALHRRSGSG